MRRQKCTKGCREMVVRVVMSDFAGGGDLRKSFKFAEGKRIGKAVIEPSALGSTTGPCTPCKASIPALAPPPCNPCNCELGEHQQLKYCTKYLVSPLLLF